MLKIDLHTHSDVSPDGGIKPAEYMELIENQSLDFIAVTDHNTIDGALALVQSLGSHIIVGEEINTLQGELIGLFLYKPVRPGMTALETAKAITVQGGLVYVPHPFETVRQGISEVVLDAIADDVDIVEVHNGRAFFQNRGPQAATWARVHNKATAASSDAHGHKGLRTAYSSIAKAPTAHNLVQQLAKARLTTGRPPMRTLLYPKGHRLRKKFGSA